MHIPNTETHPVSFSAVSVHLRHNQMCLQNTCQNGYLNITLCVYVCMCTAEVKTTTAMV